MPQSEQIGELMAAMSKAHAMVRGAAKDAKNPHLNNRYADLASNWEACREALAANGLAVVQTTDDVEGVGPDGMPCWTTFLVTTLGHSSGQWISGRLRLIYQTGEKGLKPMQTLGSALTYARRYGLSAIVGTCPEDDDGEGSGGHQPRREARPETRQPARPETRREAPNGPARPARGKAPADFKRDVLGPALDRWHAFEPVADEADEVKRTGRLVNSLIGLAIKDGHVIEAKVCKPAEAGEPLKRDRALVWDAAKWLLAEQPDWVRLAVDQYLAEKEAAARAPAPAASRN